MNIDEAVKQACSKPTLLEALTDICIWESERIVKQARTNEQWETCFRVSLKEVMEEYNQQKETVETTTVLDLIPKEILTKWDRWNWRTSSPMSLTNPSKVTVHLKNEDGSEIRVEFDLHEGVETTVI